MIIMIDHNKIMNDFDDNFVMMVIMTMNHHHDHEPSWPQAPSIFQLHPQLLQVGSFSIVLIFVVSTPWAFLTTFHNEKRNKFCLRRF